MTGTLSLSARGSEVQAYAVGLVCVSACAPRTASREEIEDSVNAQHPTGIRSRWRISEDITFASGHPMPSPCEHDSERQHWLLNC